MCYTYDSVVQTEAVQAKDAIYVREDGGEHKYPCQMVVVGSQIICVKYILSLLEHSLREIAYVSELGLSSDLLTKSFGPRAIG